MRVSDSKAREGRQQETLQVKFRTMATTHKFQFAPRFRRRAFGWKSNTPILRIKEALVEINAVSR
ncbi:hypothetical protein BN2497_3153 [Janthinobacterium sp. CG23_2]|nr:hypothetical protein BN2497_3153 [Janthinobacterium sp. CG23_2]CUU27974.1 hypothetical protein BN3177_3153 [Janthinobacterium sp. CG23_2]